jgi:hypothetical protein
MPIFKFNKLENVRTALQIRRVPPEFDLCECPVNPSAGDSPRGNSTGGEFPTQSLRSAETRVGICVKYPLLSDFDQNWNVSTNISNTLQYQAS